MRPWGGMSRRLEARERACTGNTCLPICQRLERRERAARKVRNKRAGRRYRARIRHRYAGNSTWNFLLALANRSNRPAARRGNYQASALGAGKCNRYRYRCRPVRDDVQLVGGACLRAIGSHAERWSRNSGEMCKDLHSQDRRFRSACYSTIEEAGTDALGCAATVQYRTAQP